MSDTMKIEDYLAEGGKLTSPANVPPRYRGELMRMMASFVDSALAGSAGFADVINAAPGITERIAAAKIVLEKADHAQRVLRIMGEFGVDVGRYANVHPWEARLPRDADIGATRQGGDMRLSVFHYPLQGWTDAVVFNLLMGLASTIQLRELAKVSYQPLAEEFRAILPREERHLELARNGLARILQGDAKAARAAVDFWRPHVAASFGTSGSDRFDRLKALGLRHEANDALLARWDAALDAALADAGLK